MPREGWDRLLDIEAARGKIRDTNDDFKGAAFRDETTKLLFAYDYANPSTSRVWEPDVQARASCGAPSAKGRSSSSGPW
ncbi:MAG: hypothetical protein U0163_13600 [Gemmatimonadaceae bacterium]